jgi:hypothetical protein
MNPSANHHDHQSAEYMNNFPDYLPISLMSRQIRCVQCGMEIGTEQYLTHLEECFDQKEAILDSSSIKQCPLCNQMVKNLLEHCQMCMIDNDDQNYEPLGATSVPQVQRNFLSVSEVLPICVVYFVLSFSILFTAKAV